MIYSRIASASVNFVLKTSFTYNKCAIGFVFKIQVTVLNGGNGKGRYSRLSAVVADCATAPQGGL